MKAKAAAPAMKAMKAKVAAPAMKAMKAKAAAPTMKAMKAKAAAAPAMKAMKAKAAAAPAMKAKAMTKSGLFESLEKASGVSKKDVKSVMESLESVATAELKNSGKFVIPGLTMLKLRQKAARKAGKRMAFGRLVTVKAKPATKQVKC